MISSDKDDTILSVTNIYDKRLCHKCWILMINDKTTFLYDKKLKASEPKWVNPILNIIGVEASKYILYVDQTRS